MSASEEGIEKQRNFSHVKKMIWESYRKYHPITLQDKSDVAQHLTHVQNLT